MKSIVLLLSLVMCLLAKSQGLTYDSDGAVSFSATVVTSYSPVAVTTNFPGHQPMVLIFFRTENSPQVMYANSTDGTSFSTPDEVRSGSLTTQTNDNSLAAYYNTDDQLVYIGWRPIGPNSGYIYVRTFDGNQFSPSVQVVQGNSAPTFCKTPQGLLGSKRLSILYLSDDSTISFKYSLTGGNWDEAQVLPYVTTAAGLTQIDCFEIYAVFPPVSESTEDYTVITYGGSSGTNIALCMAYTVSNWESAAVPWCGAWTLLNPVTPRISTVQTSPNKAVSMFRGSTGNATVSSDMYYACWDANYKGWQTEIPLQFVQGGSLKSRSAMTSVLFTPPSSVTPEVNSYWIVGTDGPSVNIMYMGESSTWAAVNGACPP